MLLSDQYASPQEAVFNLVRELRAGTQELEAVLVDEPWVTFTVSNASECDLQRLPETIIPFDYAFAFPKNANDDDVEMFSNAVLEMQEDGESSALAEEFISLPKVGCPLEPEISETQSIKFYQVWHVTQSHCSTNNMEKCIIMLNRSNAKTMPQWASVTRGGHVLKGYIN